MRCDRRPCPRPSIRRAPRSRLVLRAIGLLVALGAVGVGSLGGCDGDAVGVDACRQIEQHRCELAPACAGKAGIPDIKDEVQIQNCKDLYRDHCLVGLENTAKEPTQEEIDGCLAALTATTQCQKDGAVDMSACAGAAVDNPSLSPCKVFAAPEHLDACRFIESSTTAATTSSTTASTTSSSSTGTGGAGGG